MATARIAQQPVAESNGTAVKQSPEIEIVDVTPALAREWMRHNKLNRNLRERKVQQYCNDMVAGDWRWTGESVKFDINGNLIDGQHRLAARSQTYMTAITIKAWNAFRDGRSATDRPVALYRWKPGGAKPEPFPEPI